MITIVSFILVLGILVFVHELGHFLAAKKVGIRVETFSLGFPPRMIGKKIGETEYMLSWLPVGGYVKMAGQDDFKPEAGEEKPYEFYSKSIPQKIFVIAAGPVMNWLFSCLLFWFLISVNGIGIIPTTRIGDLTGGTEDALNGLAAGMSITAVNGAPVSSWDGILEELDRSDPSAAGQVLTVENPGADASLDITITLQPDSFMKIIRPWVEPVVGRVLPESPALRVGLRDNDRIISVDGQPVSQWADLVKVIHAHPGSLLSLVWSREGRIHTANIVPESKEVPGPDNTIQKVGLIGISAPVVIEYPGFFRALGLGVERTWMWTRTILKFLADLITGNASVKNLGGPIRIAQMAGQSARYGWDSLVHFVAVLGINLAIINIMPLPMFDGGHIFIFLVEGVTRKRLTFNQRAVIQYIGLAIIVLLTGFVMFNDIAGLLR